MDGRKSSRIQCCQRCRYWRAAPIWPWPRCIHPYPGTYPLLDNDFFVGPDTNCPGGHWRGLPPNGPPDPQAWQKWLQAQHLVQQLTRARRHLKPPLKKYAFQISKAKNPHTATDILAALLVFHPHLPQQIAQEIVEELHLPPLCQ